MNIARSRALTGALLVLAAALPAPAAELPQDIAARIDASSSPAAGEPTLAEIRAATARFQEIEVALAAGYVPTETCETAEMMGEPAAWGGMGVHYVRPDLLGITAPPNPRVDGAGIHTDFLVPAVLIYVPTESGAMELVAVENLVFQKAWEAAGHDAPPSFHGISWEHMADDPATDLDEAHNFEPHYDHHVWLYRENPNGVFAQYNPTVSCAFYQGAGHDH
jgi:hypothetical protein